jgi:hypothetical protein
MTGHVGPSLKLIRKAGAGAWGAPRGWLRGAETNFPN